MAAIDIRTENKEEITEIIFADYTQDESPFMLVRNIPEVYTGMVGIVSGDGGVEHTILQIDSEKQAKDMIALS